MERLPDRKLSCWSRLGISAAVLGAVLAGGAPPVGAAEEALSYAQLLEWSRGPVRWLLQPGELRELKRTQEATGAVNFVERFWGRRDPEPDRPENRFRALFFERVEAADLLYPEPGTRGSLTDRGRALILLGAPDILQITSRDSLEWDPRGSRVKRGRVVVRMLPMEVWGYSMDRLPEVLAQALEPYAEDFRIELTFVVDGNRTQLSRGEEILELVSKVTLARPF